MSRIAFVKKLCGCQQIEVKSGAEKPRIKEKKAAILMAVLAAALYALNAPVSKMLLSYVPSTIMAGLLYLGAAKTSTYYAVVPFIGAALSLVIFREVPRVSFIVVLLIVGAGTCLASID